ncbi:hypothetical protein PPUJ21368_15610 [Pseudomonas putida]|nr:hypothetical protein PPUJ21368_15610 [Pseudomonas putida]
MAVIIDGYEYLLRDLLVRWSDCHTRFDNSDARREPQLKPAAHSEFDSKSLAKLRSALAAWLSSPGGKHSAHSGQGS